MHANYLDTLDWGILIAYFLILIGIGIWASLKRKKGSSLFLAERSLKWHHIGFSMWGTNVGPSMLIASASAGFTTGIVSGNYAWYAFVFICLLAFVFAPRYLGARITTLPEFMGRRFGQSTRNILAWYTIVTILISWLALTLFAGGILIRQVFDIPMWQSALILLVISAFFTMAGGLKAVAYTNVFQMLLLIYNPQIQISAESETKRSIFREKDKTKRSKKESAQHSKSRNKSFVMTSVSAL